MLCLLINRQINAVHNERLSHIAMIRNNEEGLILRPSFLNCSRMDLEVITNENLKNKEVKI